MEKKKPSAVELFAGAGGMALGLEKAGFETVMLVENDKDCISTLKKNRPQWNVVNEDIRDVDFRGVKSDLVTGGFPCQAFSHAGHKLGFKDTRGTLFYEFARAVKEIKPKIFVAENVEAVIRNNNGKTLRTIVDILSSFGYSVQYKILNAVNFQVPQKRKRIIFVGTSKGIKFEYPEPNNEIVTLGEALHKVPKSAGEKFSARRKSMLKHVPPGGSWVDMPVEIQKKYMGKSFYSSGGRRGMARRIAWDEPCLTLTCSPGQKMTDRIHPGQIRPFTIREYARIQTFPDSWEFIGSVSSQYRQIGNAVAVKFAIALGKSLKNSLCHPDLLLQVKMQTRLKDHYN
ncbi:MAG: DNA-methyltransferase 1 protein [Marine Group I thaumarchaeote]|nr:MAG: DNA-methyltransferase 1 protein [Marine Group I thaumarchaeote]